MRVPSKIRLHHISTYFRVESDLHILRTMSGKRGQEHLTDEELVRYICQSSDSDDFISDDTFADGDFVPDSNTSSDEKEDSKDASSSEKESAVDNNAHTVGEGNNIPGILWTNAVNEFSSRLSVAANRPTIIFCKVLNRSANELDVFLKLFPRSLMKYIAQCTN
ncbi:Protein of unknown function [Gryllus bimaculatus]|nr:Protein of unknown function [Gryllus bimaculatus]